MARISGQRSRCNFCDLTLGSIEGCGGRNWRGRCFPFFWSGGLCDVGGGRRRKVSGFVRAGDGSAYGMEESLRMLGG